MACESNLIKSVFLSISSDSETVKLPYEVSQVHYEWDFNYLVPLFMLLSSIFFFLTTGVWILGLPWCPRGIGDYYFVYCTSQFPWLKGW